MKELVRNIAKYVLYKVKTYELKENIDLNLTYCFHTEKIFNKSIFDDLLNFCIEYKKITGKKAINTIMTAVNPLIVGGMREYNVSHDEFLNRVRLLEEHSTIGYHGHFWKDENDLYSESSKLRLDNRAPEKVKQQFSRDIEWFSNNNINHNSLYAAGWWYIQPEIYENLEQNNFKWDLSLSQTEFFQKRYSMQLMKEKSIESGQLFSNGNINEIQYLFGCHQTPFAECFVRRFEKINNDQSKKLHYVIGAHDYDLDSKNTLMLVEYLLKNKINFFDFDDFNKIF